MLVSPFPPSLSQRFEAGIAGLAYGGLAYQTAPEPQTGPPNSVQRAIDRFWQRFHDQITQVSQLDRPLSTLLEISSLKTSAPESQIPGFQTPDPLDWFWLSDLPWLWMLLQEPEGQREWLKQQPDPRLVLLLSAFEDLSHDLNHGGFSQARGTHSIDRFPVSSCPAIQPVWAVAVDLIQRSVSLAQGIAHWQTTETLLHLSPDLKKIGIALWLAWRSDRVSLTLAFAQQISNINDRLGAEQRFSNWAGLLPLAGLMGGFANAPFPWSLISGLDRAALQQQSDRLFGAWAGHYMPNPISCPLPCFNGPTKA
jgi:hypothetical protein